MPPPTPLPLLATPLPTPPPLPATPPPPLATLPLPRPTLPPPLPLRAHLHAALCAIRGASNGYRTPDEITTAALAGSDPLARESLDIFCGLLGSVVGNMALLYGVKGGIYLAGGILPQIRDFLMHSRFVERFLDKGPMRAALERIPVRLVEHGQLGVIGAANWYLHQRDREGHDAV